MKNSQWPQESVLVRKSDHICLDSLPGLDSLVIGEDQILGQMKRAFDFSRMNHYAGSDLSMIFDKAFKVGSRVRSQYRC